MEAAPSEKPRRRSPPIPPNYVSLLQLRELRLKEKEQQEKRQREEATAAAAAAAAKREAEMKAKRDAAPKWETKVIVASSMASGRAKERGDGGQGHQWVALAHQPAVQPPPPPPKSWEGALGRREGAMRGGRGKKGSAEAPASAPHGGDKPEGKREEEVSAVTSAQARTMNERGKPPGAADASSRGGEPEKKGEPKANAKGLGDQNAESGSSDGPGEPAEAAGASSRGRPRPEKNRKWKKGAGGRRAEPSEGSAPAETPGASQPQSVKPENTGKPKPPGPRRADASPSNDSSEVKKAAPAAEGSGELRTTAVTKPEGLVGGQRRPPAVEVQGAVEQKPRVVRRWAGPRPHGGPGNRAPEQHGRVWVPKEAAAASSSCRGGL